MRCQGRWRSDPRGPEEAGCVRAVRELAKEHGPVRDGRVHDRRDHLAHPRPHGGGARHGHGYHRRRLLAPLYGCWRRFLRLCRGMDPVLQPLHPLSAGRLRGGRTRGAGGQMLLFGGCPAGASAPKIHALYGFFLTSALLSRGAQLGPVHHVNEKNIHTPFFRTCVSC